MKNYRRLAPLKVSLWMTVQPRQDKTKNRIEAKTCGNESISEDRPRYPASLTIRDQCSAKDVRNIDCVINIYLKYYQRDKAKCKYLLEKLSTFTIHYIIS